MSIEPSTSGAIKPEIAEYDRTVFHSLYSDEKLLGLLESMKDRLFCLEEKCASQQKQICTLKTQQHNTNLVIENIKTCLRVCLEEEPDNYNQSFMREAGFLPVQTGEKISSDAIFSELLRAEEVALKNNFKPSISTEINQEIIAREAGGVSIRKDVTTETENKQLQPAPRLAEKVDEKIEHIESSSNNTVTGTILPRSIDYDTIVRTLLCLASQKKMIVKHFHKQWNDKISTCLKNNRFKQSSAEPYLYVKSNGESAIYWTPYTSDFLIAATDIRVMDEIANILTEFKVIDYGFLKNFQDMEIRRNSQGVFYINQSTYINNLSIQFGLKDAQLSGIPLDTGYLKARPHEQPMPSNTKYQNLMTSLSRVAMKSRPDIAVSVMILSQYSEAPTQSDWVEAKRIVRYLKGTADCHLRLGQNNELLGLIGYADANWSAGQISNSGYLFFLYGSPISWTSIQQSSIVSSSAKAELVALEEATRQGLQLKILIKDLYGEDTQIPTMFEDSQKCLKLVDSHEFMSRIKEDKLMLFEYLPSIKMIADMLTKPLNKNKLRELAKKCGLLFRKGSQAD